jgi:ankyrin repeat protein
MTHTSADLSYSRVIYIDSGSMTSLAIACYEGHMKVVKLLINASSPYDVNMVSGRRYNAAQGYPTRTSDSTSQFLCLRSYSSSC